MKYVVTLAKTFVKASMRVAKNGEEVAVEVAVKVNTDEDAIKSSSALIL